MGEEVRSYQDLLIWHKAMNLAELAYRLAKLMPKAEEYRLTSQLLRAATSIPANIAEGHSLGTQQNSSLIRMQRMHYPPQMRSVEC